jgi:hypothetical protein
MLFNFRKFPPALVVGLLLAFMSVTYISNAHADNDDDDDRVQVRHPAVVDAKWATECSACHVAYPARYLPAESWRAIMSGLSKHFGSDASLDAPAVKEITIYLEKNASRSRRKVSGKPVLRITETHWWKSEHRRVAAWHWKSPKVKSPSNCGACHTTADKGDFSERHVRIPK